MKKEYLLLAGLVISILFLGLGGAHHLYSADGLAQWQVARNILRGDGPVLPPELAAFGRTVDGKIYSKFGIGESLLLLPLILFSWLTGAAVAAGPGWEQIVVSAFNGIVVAALAAAFYWLTAAFAAPRQWRRTITMVMVFTTPLWPYAKTLFPEPLCALGLVVALGFLVRNRPLLAGLVWGYLISIRLDLLIMLPCWLVFMPSRSWRQVGWFLLGVLPGVLLVAGYNYGRYGSLLTTGFGDPDERFSTPLLLGVTGLLFSPGKALFLYAPVLLLLPLAWLQFSRKHARLAWLLLASSVVYVLLHAKWYAWMGGWCWGPRRLVPLLPLLCLPLLALSEMKGWRWRLFTVLALLGLIVNFLGVAVNYNDYLTWAYYAHDTIFDWRWSPLVWHFAHIAAHDNDFLPASPGLALLWTAVWLGLAGWCWVRLDGARRG